MIQVISRIGRYNDVKLCSTCQEVKPFAEFYLRPNGKPAWGQCKPCGKQRLRDRYRALTPEQKEAEKQRLRKHAQRPESKALARYISKRWREKNPEKVRASRWKTRYGLTLEEYDALLDQYGRMCGICSSLDDLVLDHDHGCCPAERTCGRCLRGVLCRRCNSGIGLLKDSVSLVEKAVAYLKQKGT